MANSENMFFKKGHTQQILTGTTLKTTCEFFLPCRLISTNYAQYGRRSGQARRKVEQGEAFLPNVDMADIESLHANSTDYKIKYTAGSQTQKAMQFI